jgi:hypothetical protein
MVESLNNLVIRKYKEGDEYQINNLFNLVFSKTRTLKEWYWKFKSNPFGSSIILIAEQKNHIVSHTASVPIKIKIDKDVFTCYQSLDVMVVPHLEARWVFAKVFKGMNYEMDKLNRMHIGFPGKKAHDIETKGFDIKSVGHIDIFLKTLEDKNLNQKEISVNECRTKEINYFDTRFDELWGMISNNFTIAIVRNAEYLNWRYIQNPNNNYYKIFALEKSNKILGYVILKIKRFEARNVGYIVDLFALKDKDIIEKLLLNAIYYLEDMGVDLIIFCLKDTFISDMLLAFGFVKDSISNQYTTYIPDSFLVALNFNPQIQNEIVYNLDNWFIMMGDSDWE